jgi:hypothetical protein
MPAMPYDAKKSLNSREFGNPNASQRSFLLSGHVLLLWIRRVLSLFIQPVKLCYWKMKRNVFTDVMTGILELSGYAGISAFQLSLPLNFC